VTRRIIAVTGSRAEYGAMRPVFRAIAAAEALELDVIVTGMHLAPEFAASLAEIEADSFSRKHRVDVRSRDGTRLAMACALGEGVVSMAHAMARIAPDIVLVQGDRGEMLAATMAAAHLDIPVAHMSGGDRTGSIDDAIRNAITSFAHIHLTTCPESTQRVIAVEGSSDRVFEVGEPALDTILALEPLPWGALAQELALDSSRPVVLAVQHPVTTEADESAAQVIETLEALAAIGMQTVFTYPNTDAGGDAIVDVLEAWRGRSFLRIVPHLGSLKYLSLMRQAAVLVGNSSSGIIEAPSFKLPVVNVGTRQHRRTRANNVIDVGYNRHEIRAGVEHALGDAAFRAALADCHNPYGDGRCAARTAKILASLRLGAGFTAKWLERTEAIVDS
jgi:UDP-N-acetylglucosamine 2-epimerase (non-hydrolysing)/GDP/UDP-N,N'-diacetylbacillosamine 2-epimerase (hydrolysing)